LLEWADSKPEYKDILQEIEDTPVTFDHGLDSMVGKLLEPISGSARFDIKYMDETAKHLGNIFRTILNDPEVPAQKVKLSEGDVLFFDNEKTLHARNEYSDLARVSLRVRMAR
jgi:ectoine hydroxylase-related dioxygenase (phytanoyl-CoA dioxygenase family)